MAAQDPARRLYRVLLVALVLLVLLARPVAGEARDPRDRQALHWGIACSVVADAADVASTAVAFHRRPDVIEGNLLFGTRRDLRKILILKGIGAVAINGIAVWLHDDYPTPSLWLTFGNCALKSAITAHNLRIAFRVSW